MPEIKGIYIEDKRQDAINKELSDDYKNFENIKGYNNEMAALGKKYLNKMGDKIKEARGKIIDNNSLKEKYPDKYNQFEEKFQEYENEIQNNTKSLNNKEWRKRHEIHINKLGSIIDNYEKDAIQLIYELAEDMGDAEVIQKERGNIDKTNGKVKYLDIGEDGIYTLTKATNRPKIHQVLGNVLSPGEVRKIDYSDCSNAGIKNRMATALSSNAQEGANSLSYSCFLNYDETTKTYVLSDGKGFPISQRALIWEGVKLTPPSKIRSEAKIAKKEAEQAQIDKINNVNLTKQEQQDLVDSMPEKLRKKLKKEDRDAFFQITESSINEAIKQAKLEGYELQSVPVGKHGGRDYYVTLNLRNAGSKAEIERPFIKKEDLRKYGIKDNNKFKNYISQRVSTKRNSFDYLTKKGSTIKEGEYGVGNELDEDKKAFAIKGLQMLSNWADAVLDKIGDTKIKDDDIEFTALKTYIRDVINDIESGKFTDKNIESTKEKISSMLSKFFKHNRFRSSMQINENEIKGCINNILTSQNKESQIIAMRKLGASRTWFDNSQTAFLRDDIFEEYGRTPKKDENGNVLKDEEGNIIYEEGVIDLKDDEYEKYFEKINELYSVNPETDIGENNEIKEPKRTNIDKLYEAARTTGKHSLKNFKQRLVDNKLLPNWRGHGGQIDDKVRALKSQLQQQEKNANKFQITADEIRQRTKQGLAVLQLSLTSKQIQSAEGGDAGENDEGIRMLNAYNFMLQQDDSFFKDLATKETEDTKKSIKYCGVDGVVRGNLAPYLIRRGGGINSDSEMAKIYNNSVGAGGWLDFSDEGAERIGPLLKDIIVEVVVTAVSILLCWNGAGEAIYTAYRSAKILSKGLKGIKKLLKFMKVFSLSLLRSYGTQLGGKFVVNLGKGAKAASQVSHIATATEKGLKLGKKIKSTIQVIKKTETFGSLARKLAMKGGSMIIEGTTFHINNTLIHNILNGEDRNEGLIPWDYVEGPDGEKIYNYQSYAQSIAFLAVLKLTGKLTGELTPKSLGNITGESAEAAMRTPVNRILANKFFSLAKSLGSEMGNMMVTDQILSLAFEHEPKAISFEDLISMFGMVVGLRLNGRFQAKIKEHAGRKMKLEMKQEGTGNIFNVSIDKEGNVLKVEGVDKNGKKIKNPEQVCGIKAGDNGMNMRDIPNVMGEKTGTIEGGSRAKKNLDNLEAGDEITIKQGDNNIKLKKTADGKREVTDPGGNTAYKKGTKFEIEQNQNEKTYHLKNTEGKGTLSLDGEYIDGKPHKKGENGRIDVKLKSRFGNEKVEIKESERGQKKSEVEGLREKKEKSKSNIEDGERRLNETQKEIELKEKNNESLKEREKELNKKKQDLEQKQERLNELEKTLEKKEFELQNEKERNKAILNDLEGQALENLDGKNIYINGVEYSCSYTTTKDGITHLTLTRKRGKFFTKENNFSQKEIAPKSITITSYSQLETISIEKGSGKKRKVSASNGGNDINKKSRIDSGERKAQKLLDELFNPSEGSLGKKIQKAREKLETTEEKIKINKQEIVDNKNDIQKTVNDLKDVNENFSNIQHEKKQNQSDINNLRGKENKIKSEIKTEQNKIKDIDADLLKAETEVLEIQLEEMEQNETIEIDGKVVEVTDYLKESTRKQIESNKDKLGISGKKTVETNNNKNQNNTTSQQQETKNIEIEKAENELKKAEEEYKKAEKELKEQQFNLGEEATQGDGSSLGDGTINKLENELKAKEQAVNEAKEKYEKLTNGEKQETKEGNTTSQQKETQEGKAATQQKETQDLNKKLSKIEQEQIELKKQTEILEKQLKEMNKNRKGKIKIDGKEIKVTDELIKETKEKIKSNKGKINTVVNVEQDGTISILKSDFSTEKILPDGTICKGDFDMNGDLISGLKTHPDGSREYGVFEGGKLSMGCHEIKLPNGGYKQTYITLNGTYEIKLNGNRKMIGATEKVGDGYRPATPEVIGGLKTRFKKFQEDLKDKQEQKRKNREQRAKEREEVRKKQLTYKEKNILKHITKEAPTLPENISKEYYLGNGEKIRLKKLKNGKFVEVEKLGGEKIDDTFIERRKGNEMTANELEAYLKKRIIESRIGVGGVENKGKGSEIVTTTKEDGSTFMGEVDKDGNRMQGKQILKDGTIKKGFFVDKELNEGIIIKNENGIKKIEFKGKTDRDFIKKEIAEIEKTINSNERIEIKLSENKTIKIEKIGSDLVEVLEGEGTRNVKIKKGALGEYVEKRAKEVYLKQEIDKFTSSKAEKEQELQKLKEKGDLTKEEIDKKEKLEKQIKSYEKAIEALNDRNTNYESGIKRVKEKISKQKEKLNKLNKNSSEYRNTEKDIKKLEKQLKGYETAQGIMQNGTEIVKKVSRREILKKEIETLVLKAKKLVTHKESNEYKELEIKINNINKEINNLKTDIQKFIDITYIGIRDLKGLGDEDLMYLTHTYLEKILDPIKFSVIDHLSTFNPLKVDQNFQSIKKFETTGKSTNIERLKIIEKEIQKIKVGGYSEIKSMSEANKIIEKFGEGTYEKDILYNLKESLENNISNSDHRLPDSERAVIFVNSVAYMLDYKAAFPNATAEQIYKILDRNQNKIIHQHIQDKRYLTGSSHDVLHILRGNMDMAENFMKYMSPLERVMTRQIIIDHDMGYTSQFNDLLSRKRSNTFFSSTKDHPLRSTVFVEQNKSRYIENFGKKGYDIIEKSITGHSKADTKNLPTERRNHKGAFDEKVINSVISTVDCAAASADYKSAFLFSHPEMTGQFLNVYKSMKEGDVNNAIKYLEKMSDIAKSVKDPELRNALKEALNSLHLVNVNGESQSILRKKINEIDNSSSKDLTENFIDNLIKSYDANSNDPTKKFRKIIKKFETANNTKLDVENIETLEEIKKFCEEHREYFEGNNGEGESPIKKYLKYDYIDERVSFPFEKYLSQYGVRVSRTETGEIKINSNDKGIVEAEFELAGKTFENLVNEGDANFALASFKKVCDDFNIDIKNNTGIKELEKIINEWKKGRNKTLVQTIKDNLNEKVFKDKDNNNNIVGKGFGDKIELYGKNGEKVTLNFDGKNYEGFDRSYDFMKKFEDIRNEENIIGIQDYISELQELTNIVNRIHGENNNYTINGKSFAEYIDNQIEKITKCEEMEQAKRIINETLDEIEKGNFKNY